MATSMRRQRPARPILTTLYHRALPARRWIPAVTTLDRVAVLRAAAACRGETRRHVRQIAGHAALSPPPATGPAADTVSMLFGPVRAPSHALAARPLYRHVSLHEPQVTEALAAFLVAGRSRRVAGFLRALLAAVGPDARPAWPAALRRHVDSLAPSVPLSAKAEAPAGGTRRRIDLLITCDMADSRPGADAWRFAVAVEVKFDARLHGDQLTSYRDAVTRRCRGGPYGLFLLHPHSVPLANRDHPDWIDVRWRPVLAAWDRIIADAGDTGSDFARFRRSLWDRILAFGL